MLQITSSVLEELKRLPAPESTFRTRSNKMLGSTAKEMAYVHVMLGYDLAVSKKMTQNRNQHRQQQLLRRYRIVMMIQLMNMHTAYAKLLHPIYCEILTNIFPPVKLKPKVNNRLQ